MLLPWPDHADMTRYYELGLYYADFVLKSVKNQLCCLW